MVDFERGSGGGCNEFEGVFIVSLFAFVTNHQPFKILAFVNLYRVITARKTFHSRSSNVINEGESTYLHSQKLSTGNKSQFSGKIFPGMTKKSWPPRRAAVEVKGL
jgi:hypothetical protein